MHCAVLLVLCAHHLSYAGVKSSVLTLSVATANKSLQMLAKPSSNLLQRIGGNHRGGHTQPG